MGREQGRTVGTGRGWRDAALVPSLVAVGAMVAIHLEPRRAADPDDRRPGPCLAQHGAVAAHRGSAHRRPGDARARSARRRDPPARRHRARARRGRTGLGARRRLELVRAPRCRPRPPGGGPRPPAGDDGHRPQPPATEKAARTIATLSITTAIGIGLGYPITSAITELFNYTPPSGSARSPPPARSPSWPWWCPRTPGRTTVGST